MDNFELYDSLNLFESAYILIVKNMLSTLFNTSKQCLNENWCFRKIFKPSQENYFDCGAFIYLFASYSLLNSSPLFSQNQIPDFREHIINEIAAGKILPFDILQTDKSL
jgi:Ulp1 family protease